MKNSLAKPFLIILVISVLIGCFFVFQPFLIEIVIAAVLVTVLYKPYLKLVKFFKGRRTISALIMCVLVLLLIVLPLTEIIILAAKNSGLAYNEMLAFVRSHGDILQSSSFAKINFWGFDTSSLQNFVIDVMGRSSSFMMNSATAIVKGTTNFILSLLLIILTMFFFFLDGERMMKKLMYWSPLSNKYDQQLFEKFRSISYTTLVSTFAVMVIEGLLGALAFYIVGLPALLAGILIAIVALIPVVGSGIIYIPVSIYLLLVGEIWQGIFILLWTLLIVGTVVNFTRTYIIKGKAEINPIFIFFSILGGIAFFGFWGIILGPLMISIAVTVFHIYELEFKNDLDPVVEEKSGKTIGGKVSK